MQEFDVILTDGGGHVGCHIARSLSRRGLRVCVCDNAANPASPRTRSIASVVSIPLTRDEMNFIRAVRAIVDEHGARMIMPVFYPEVLARHRDAFPGIIIPVDSEDKLCRLDNKLSACELASELGITQAHRYRSIDEVDRYPVVFKRCGGHGGDSVYFPKTRATLENLMRSAAPGSWLLTEEIDGTDVSVDALRWSAADGDSAFFAAGAYKVLLPRAKGISVLRESIIAPELVNVARTMLDALDFRGVCGFDFRVDRSGKAYFLECNPRFSGGLASQIAAGIDLPWLLWQLAAGEDGFTGNGGEIKPGLRTGSRAGMVDCMKRMKRMGNLQASDLFYLFSPLKIKDL